GGFAAGLVALTRPEFELAVVVAAGLWLLLRARAGLGGFKEAVLVAAPALAVPAAVYGAFLVWISPHRLIYDNLYPVDTLRAGPDTLYKAYAPLTVSSFAALAGKLLLYAAGTLALLALARLLMRRGRARIAGYTILGAVALALVAGSIARPETLRYYLRYGYGWIPAGVAIAVVVLLLR